MKKSTLVFIAILSCIRSYTQIKLEHVYPNVSITIADGLEIVNLGKGVYNYISIDYRNSTFTLYNLNHSVNVTGTIPVSWNDYPYYKAQYFSNSMFDCDSSTIEYILSYGHCIPPPCSEARVSVYRTDGTLLFSQDSATTSTWIGGSTIYRNYIVNTSNGTKLLLDCLDGSVKVFGLCDSLPTNSHQLVNDDRYGISNSFPNPSTEYTIINYALPLGIKDGIIVFYDTMGNEIKRYKIDRSFDHLKISTSDFMPGTYYYNLQTSKGTSGAKKLMTIK